MQLNSLNQSDNVASLEQALAVLLNSNESLMTSIKQLIPNAEALEESFDVAAPLLESVNNGLLAIGFNANNLCELATKTYSLCCQSKQKLHITLSPSVQLTQELSIDMAYINPIIKPNITDTISQACFVLAHICHSLDALPAALANDDDVLSTLHTVIDLLGSLQAAYYIGYITLTTEPSATTSDITTLALPLTQHQ